MAVPCIVLTALGVRIIVQQEELAEKHAADERRLQVSEFGRALSSRLEQIRENPRDPAVALVATVADGRLVLPWEVSLRLVSPVAVNSEVENGCLSIAVVMWDAPGMDAGQAE